MIFLSPEPLVPPPAQDSTQFSDSQPGLAQLCAEIEEFIELNLQNCPNSPSLRPHSPIRALESLLVEPSIHKSLFSKFSAKFTG